MKVVPIVGALLLALVIPAGHLAASGEHAPQVAAAATLSIAGDVTKPATFTVADLKAMPRVSVQLPEDGRTITYEGVLVTELLRRAGVPVGSELRGNALASYVMATAKDGYQVLFSLAELDNGFSRSEIMIADSVDGKPLFDYQGPFRLVAPKDTRPARGVRMLERLEIVRLKK